jgi:hypothetical protein
MLPAALRRHGVSLTIAVLAAVLGVYLYVVDSGRLTTKELEARKRNLFRAWRRGEIAAITIEQKGESVRIVKRTDDAGDVTYDLAGGEAADPAAVDKLLGVLEFATPERRVEAGGDRHAMGLDAPRARLALTMGSVVHKLSIGGPAPAPAGGAYAEVEGEGLFVVSRDLVTELLRPGDVYRGRTLIPYLSSSLSALTLEGEGGARRFVTGAWGGWAVMRGDQPVRIDRDTFDRMLTSLAEVRAESFTSDVEADSALANAAANVRIVMTPRTKTAPRAVIDVGGECPGQPDDVVAVRREPLPRKSACVPKGVMGALGTPLDRFVDVHLFSLRADEMEAITLSAGAEKLEIVRLGTGFHQRAPTEGNVETDVGQAFARSLRDVVAQAVLPGARPGEALNAGSPSPRDAPVTSTATIARIDGGEENAGTETIELSPPEGDFVEVRRVTDGARLKLTREAANVLRPSGLALRSRKVLDESANHVRRVVIDSAAVRQTFLRSPSGGFTLEEPKSLTIDAGVASDVTEVLVKLRADRWVAESDDGSYGFGTGGSHYDLELESGAVRIETGAATRGGVFARRGDRPEVFVLGDASRRSIETWAVDRSYFMIEAADVRRIHFERGSLKWEYTAGSTPPSASPKPGAAPEKNEGAERFEVVRKALSEARTEGVVHLGPPRKEEGFGKPGLVLTVRVAPPPPAEANEIRIVVGRGDVFRDNNVFYVRRAGIDATFAIAQSKLRALMDLQ